MILTSLWSQQIGSEELFDLIIRTIFTAGEEDEDEGTILDPEDAEPIVKGLIKAYVACLKREGEEPKLTEDKRESEKVYQANYFKAFPEAKDADGMGWYPESMPYEGGIPLKVLQYAGQGIGTREKREQEAWFAYYQEHREEIETMYSGSN